MQLQKYIMEVDLDELNLMPEMQELFTVYQELVDNFLGSEQLSDFIMLAAETDAMLQVFVELGAAGDVLTKAILCLTDVRKSCLRLCGSLCENTPYDVEVVIFQKSLSVIEELDQNGI